MRKISLPKCARGLAAAVALLSVEAGHGEVPAVLPVGEFSKSSAGGHPANWRPLTFDKIARHSVYELVEDAGVVVLAARSDRAAAGLTRAIAINPREYPIVQWRWKVENTIPGGDVRRKSGDDYAARLYITFAYDPATAGAWERAKMAAARALYGEYPPRAALNYIWANRAPVGTVAPNPYTKRVRMIAVQSGAPRAGVWVGEARNIADDYRAAFGAEPPPISGVAVMTDTDNTQTTARAWFGDIIFKSAAE